jgi:hypothetical protein
LVRHFARQRIPQWIRLDCLMVVYEYTEFQKPTANHFHLNVILITQLARHPGGDPFLRRSNGTISNLDLSHHTGLLYMPSASGFAFR